MKILVVHEVSYEKKVVYEIHEFPELLALRGHEVTFFDFDEGATRQSRREPRDRYIQGRIHSDARIRLVTPHRLGIPAIDRIWAIFSSVGPLRKLIKSGGFDVILNYAVPTYGLQVGLFGKLYSVPVIQRALDVASQIRESFWNPLIGIFERFCFGLATVVSTNNPAMTSYVTELMGEGITSKIQLHYPPLDQRIFKEVPYDSQLAQKFGISPSDRVIMYMGSFFYFSGLDEVIKQLPRFIAKDPMVKLLLVGGGEQEEELRSLVSELGIEDQVIFTGFVDFYELPRFMTLGNVAINPLKVSTVAGAAFPHKVLQYMAVGLPTVSTKLDGLYAAFGDKSGIVWAQDTGDVLNQALELSYQSKEKRGAQIRLQREVLESLFAVQVTVEKLEESMKQLSKKRDKKWPKQ